MPKSKTPYARLLLVSLLLAFACALLGQLHLPGAGSNAKTSPAVPKTSSTNAPQAQSAPGSFDFYLLSLSWAPGFCADASNAAANPQECGAGKHIGFIVHGLWPEALSGQNPESCAPAKPVSKAVLKLILPYMLSASLVQHEWATHGTCTGLTQQNFFTEVIQARVAVQIPVQISSLAAVETESPEQIETQFATANMSFPAAAFRTACRGSNLEEARICFTRDLKPMECAASVTDCSSPTLRVLPPQ